jgi:GntR family transcriptional repressor for pyruvate dehydrogenase complex
MFETVDRKSVADRVCDQIRSQILAGQLKPGSQLPAEKTLIRTFGVSRPTLREALSKLVGQGLLVVRPGQGAFVAEPDASLLTAQLDRFVRIGPGSYEDLVEVRRILEVSIAGLAAQRAEGEDLERLRKTLAEMDESLQSPEEYVEAHLAFHRGLAEATGNAIFPLFMDVLNDLLRKRTHAILHQVGAVEQRQMWHHRIYKAVADHDVAAARDAMEQHLMQASQDGGAGALANP